MDQSYTNLPRFTENFKSETGLAHIHHHLTGVLSHGTKKSYVYTWTDLFSSDCNVTLNSLMLVLTETNNGFLLPVLYLQADNSAKAYSPDGGTGSRGHISDVQLHQQESPDTQAYNIPDLHDMVPASFTSKLDAGHMESLWDFEEMVSYGECLRGIKDPHVLKLTKMSGRVILSYNDWPLVGENYREVALTV